MTAILLPALVAGVIVWLAGSIIHMALPHHKTDYSPLPSEGSVTDALRDSGIEPGQYLFPMPAKPGDWKDEDFQARAKRGPVGITVIGPNGMPNMGKQLGLHLVYTIVVSIFVGYIAYAGLGPDADYLTTFRVTGCAALIAYSAAHFANVIWYFYNPSYAWKFFFDAIIYAVLTGGTFGWLY